MIRDASHYRGRAIACYVGLRNAQPNLLHCAQPILPRYRVSQGREVGHDAIIELTVADGEVWSGGRVCGVVRGEIDWR